MKTQYAALCGLAMLFSASTVLAVPNLQLDIVGGFYDPVDETIVSTGPVFDLVTYGKVGVIDTSDTFHLSVALLTSDLDPVTAAGNYGTFSINGTTFNATGSMSFGVPPVEGSGGTAHDGGDLGRHGVFDTYFLEISFLFDPAQTSASVNTQDTPGTDPTANPGSALYYELFSVDASGLLAGYILHFDLYSKKSGCPPAGPSAASCTDLDIALFAPFSHDARSGVPDPAPLALLGLGLLGLGFARRRRLN